MSVSPNTIRLPWNNIEIRYKKGDFKPEDIEAAAKEAFQQHPNPFNVHKDTFVPLGMGYDSSVIAAIREPNQKGQPFKEVASAKTGSFPEAVKRILKNVAEELAKK